MVLRIWIWVSFLFRATQLQRDSDWSFLRSVYASVLALNSKHLSFFFVSFLFVNNVDKNLEKVQRRYKGVYAEESRGLRFTDTRTVVRDPTGSTDLLRIYDKSRRLDQSWRKSYRRPTAGSSSDCSFNWRDYKRTIYKVPSRGPGHGNYSLIAPLFPNFHPVRGNCTNNPRIWKHPLLWVGSLSCKDDIRVRN